MELCLRGTLSELIHHGTPRQLDPLRAVPLARGIARGLLHLHTRRPPILHRDVKPGNVLLGSGGVPKVADFGMSRFVGAAGTARQGLGRALSVGVIGTAAYSAPELMEEGAPGARAAAGVETLKADVYSFGVVLWEMLARKRPHAGLDEFQIQTLWYLDPAALSLPPLGVPDAADAATRHALRVLQTLVTQCTRVDPAARPDIRQVLDGLKAALAPPAETVNPLLAAPGACEP